MVTEKRLVDVDVLIAQYKGCVEFDRHEYIPPAMIVEDLESQPLVDAVEVPCKIGDFVWAIRNFKGKKHPQRGIVSDMYFLKDMSLQIVVKYVARGKWGETIFATDKEAYAAIEERKSR